MSDAQSERSSRLEELLEAWEESREAGLTFTAADLCADCPELQTELQVAIEELLAFDELAGPVPVDDPLNENTPASPNGRANRHPRLPALPGYEFLEEIGRGGMGVVYKARHLALNRLVAIKMLHQGAWAADSNSSRFRAEALALARLNHPHVVHIIDLVEGSRGLYIVLELVEGSSLARRPGGALSNAAEAARIAHTLANTIEAVHRHGMLHRDIKPANILIDHAGQVKITDFGLVRDVASLERQSLTGDLLGSPSYMAPEQATGKAAHFDVRTDVYGVGATLYEMLTGRPPFVGSSVVDTLDQVREREPVSPRLLNPSVPRDLETICLKCLEKEPARRIASAQDLADELERYERAEPIRSRPTSRIERGWRWCRRRPVMAALLLTLAITTLMLIGSLIRHERDLSHLNHDLEQALASAQTQTQRAEQESARATESERSARDMLYASSIRLAADSLAQRNTRAARDLLNRVVAAEGRADQRGFEWWYLHGRLERDHRDLLQNDAAIYFICLSPDGKRLATAGKDAIVRILDPETGAILSVIPTGQLEVNGVTYSPDGTELATAGDDGTIHFYSLDTNEERLRIDKAFPKQAYQLVYTPDGTQVICCGNAPIIRQFDARSGESTGEYHSHTISVHAVAMLPGGRQFASAGGDAHLKFWDITAHTLAASVQCGHAMGAIATDDNHVVVGGSDDGILHSWRIDQATELSRRKHLDGVGAVALQTDRRLIAAGDASGGIRIWHLAHDGQIAESPSAIWSAHKGRVSSLVWSPDGARLISAGDDGRVVSWSREGIVAQLARRFPVDSNDSNSFGLIPHAGQLVTAGRQSPGLRLHNWKSGIEEHLLDGPPFRDVAPSPDGRYVAAIKEGQSGLNNIRVFPTKGDWHSPPGDRSFASWHMSGTLGGLRFAPDGSCVAAKFSGKDPEGPEPISVVFLFPFPDSNSPVRIPVPDARILAFLPDGRRLVIGTDRQLVLWDIGQNQIIWSVDQPEDGEIQISPDGKLIATAGLGRDVTVRNANDGSLRYQLAGHTAKILSLAFSPDGRTLASSGAEGVIKLWHVATGEASFDLTEPGGEYLRIEFTHDGQHLLGLFNGETTDEIVVFGAERDAAASLGK